MIPLRSTIYLERTRRGHRQSDIGAVPKKATLGTLLRDGILGANGRYRAQFELTPPALSDHYFL